MSPTFPLFRTLVLLVLAVLVAVSPRLATAAPAVEGPRVLILHSYAPDFSWTRDLHAGIVSVLDTPEVRARYRVEYLDAKHHDTPAYQARLLELFREKYQATPFDGIIVTDNHALELVARHRAELFPRPPPGGCRINPGAATPARPAGPYNLLEKPAPAPSMIAPPSRPAQTTCTASSKTRRTRPRSLPPCARIRVRGRFSCWSTTP